jgi:hypothetical protein
MSGQRHLVALRHLVAQVSPSANCVPAGKAAVVGHDGHVVGIVHADVQRYLRINHL